MTTNFGATSWWPAAEKVGEKNLGRQKEDASPELGVGDVDFGTMGRRRGRLLLLTCCVQKLKIRRKISKTRVKWWGPRWKNVKEMMSRTVKVPFPFSWPFFESHIATLVKMNYDFKKVIEKGEKKKITKNRRLYSNEKAIVFRDTTQNKISKQSNKPGFYQHQKFCIWYWNR